MNGRFAENHTCVTLAAPWAPPYIALDAGRHPKKNHGAGRIKGSGRRGLMGPPPYNIAETKR